MREILKWPDFNQSNRRKFYLCSAATECKPCSLSDGSVKANKRFSNVSAVVVIILLQDVIRALNRNPKIFLPPDTTFAVIQPFIREAVKMAWQMSALAHPLDISVATDAELFDSTKYVSLLIVVKILVILLFLQIKRSHWLTHRENIHFWIVENKHLITCTSV